MLPLLKNTARHSTSTPSSLSRLRELTEQLPCWTASPATPAGDYQQIAVDVISGANITTGIYKTPEFAIAVCVDAPNTRFPRHAHKACEYFIVLEGEMTVHYDDGQRFELQRCDSHYVPVGVAHQPETVRGCRYLAITVPASAFFPAGPAGLKKR